MKRRDESFETLVGVTLWTAFIVAAFFYVRARFGLTPEPAAPVSSTVGSMIAAFGPWMAFSLLILGVVSVVYLSRRKALLKTQEDVAGVRDLPWQSFKTLVGGAYRRDGYSVWENSAPGPDSGIDFVAKRDGQTVIVQCREWKNPEVGVGKVREMFGLLDGAGEMHIVTGGHFTEEARAFAGNRPIRLIDGATLKGIIGNSQAEIKKQTPVETPALETQAAAPTLTPEKRHAHHGEKKWSRGRHHAPSP